MTKRILMAALLVTVLITAGCKKKTPPAPTPPPPPPPKQEQAPAPMINSFTANPMTVTRGQSSTLRWDVSNATEVTIEGVGQVTAGSGSRDVYPSQNITYRLTAKGAGGTAEGSVRVTVREPEAPPPPPPPPPPAAPKLSFDERVRNELQDAYFDYDQHEIRADARTALQKDGDALKEILKDFPTAIITIEGHCDERGSAEYNLGLGDRRSSAAKEFLSGIGVPGDRIRSVSYGKEKPQCMEQSESCWQKNRRVHFVGQ